MKNRIEVEKEIRQSTNHEHFVHFAISLIGVVVPITLWLAYYGKITSPIWWGFFTVGMIFVSTISFCYGLIKIIKTAKALLHYRKVLTLYANIDEQTHIPEEAIVTTCLRTDTGRFGFQKINYYVWLDATELVFFPVRPEFRTSKMYHIVQSIRLNSVMLRSYSLIGKQYDEGVRIAQENYGPADPLSFSKSRSQPLYRDTRATLLAYAFGEQTLFMAFDSALYDQLHKLFPDKDKLAAEEKKVTSSELKINSVDDKDQTQKPANVLMDSLETPIENTTIDEPVIETSSQLTLDDIPDKERN